MKMHTAYTRISLLAAIAAVTSVLFCGVPAAQAYASTSIDAPAQTTSIRTNTDRTIRRGTWGTCPWEITEDGELIIHAGKAANSHYMYGPLHDAGGIGRVTKVTSGTLMTSMTCSCSIQV
ncbi:hypothetical protein D2E26_1292 [Bifidobacterium dolichotidis]|uniref:Uncharacterized protein n=1 Tax=Bifidobacterium dolichotidis TaxID=2306976 RepID=A0A430FQZ1_9BIFI|nr:hypothetical protein D2E26_1292 [Bifidobacterium dolichotidis]